MDLSIILEIVKLLKEKTKKTSTNEKHNRTEEEEKEILRSHPLFVEIQSTDIIKLEQISVSDLIKKRMTIFYMKLLFKELQIVANTIVDNYGSTRTNITQITDLLYNSVTTIRDDAVAGGVPPIFIEKFSPRLMNNVSIVTTSIMDVHNISQYTDVFSETLAILDVILLYTRFTLDALGGIVEHMNGELHHALEGSVFDN